MTSPLIERVARAIKDRTLEQDNDAIEGLTFEDAKRCARAAIEAMREPTRGIVDAAINHGLGDFEGAWRAAVAAALEEKSNVR